MAADLPDVVERFVADVSQYVERVERAAREADRFGEANSQAADRARRAGHVAAEAAERAARAQARAAAEAERLARGEGSVERAAQAAARAERELERAQMAQAAAGRAAARAADEQEEQYRQLAREAERAAFTQRLAMLRASGSIREHNALLRRLRRDYEDFDGDNFREMQSRAQRAFGAIGNLVRRTTDRFEQMGGVIGKIGGHPVGALLLVAAVLTAIPVAAGAVATAVTLGIGGALAVIGIKAAAQSAKVRAEFSGLKADVADRLKGLAKPFEVELLTVAKIARSTFDDLAPSLGRSFSKIAPLVTQLAAGIGIGLSGLESNIDGIVDAFGPLISTLSRRMPDVIAELGNAFEKIAAQASPRFIDMLVDSFIVLIRVTAGVIEHLAWVGDKVALLWETFKKIPGVKGIFEDASEGAKSSGNAIGQMGDKTNKAAEAMDKLAQKIAEAANNALNSRGSMRALEAAIDDAAGAAKKNGANLDINTAKGRANQEALDNIAASAHRMADAMRKNGQDASAAMTRARQSFIRVALQMGLTKTQAAKLADQLGLTGAAVRKIPDSKTINVKAKGTGDAIRASKQVSAAVRSVPQTWDIYFRTHNIGAAIRASKDMSRAQGGIVKRAEGGIVQRFPSGGFVRGPGTTTSDSIAALLSDKEFVVNAAATRNWRPVLEAINKMGHRTTPQAPMLRSAPAPMLARQAGTSTVVHVHHTEIHVAGTVVAERQLLDLVQTQAAKRNVRNPGLQQFGAR